MTSGDPVDIEDSSPATINAVIAKLKDTVAEDDLYYREAELDALFTLFDMEVSEAVRRGGPNSPRADHCRAARDAVHRAHDLVAAGNTNDAAAELVGLLATAGATEVRAERNDR